MAKSKTDLWGEFGSEFGSEFFSEVDGGESLNETIPVSEVRSTVADHRQILQLICVIDGSGSMAGQRIAMVNNAIENIIKELKSHDDMNAVIKLSLLKFSQQAEWLTPAPIAVTDFVFKGITITPSITNYGTAFEALNKKLNRRGFMNPDLGEYFAPLILFISDGEPTDPQVYPQALEKLKKNGWFKKSSRYAIAVGENAKTKIVRKVLTDFAEDELHVRYADEGSALCSLIEFIAVRASEVQTTISSSTAGTDDSLNWSEIFSAKDESLFSSLFSE